MKHHRISTRNPIFQAVPPYVGSQKIHITHSELADWLSAMAYDFEYGEIAQTLEEMEPCAQKVSE